MLDVLVVIFWKTNMDRIGVRHGIRELDEEIDNGYDRFGAFLPIVSFSFFFSFFLFLLIRNFYT